MAERNPAGWIQARTDHTAENDRLFMLQNFLKRDGVCDRLTDLTVNAQSSPNMSVQVAAGGAFIDGSESTNQGYYSVYNDAIKNITITAAHATLPRKDIIVAKVQDAQYSGSTNAWSLVVVTGTANASPVAPTAPANSLLLAVIDVAANATTITNGVITDWRHTFATRDSGVAVGASFPADPHHGMPFFNYATNRYYVYNAYSTWQLVGPAPTDLRASEYSGGGSITIPASQNPGLRNPDTGTVIGLTFTAPPSGIVTIGVHGRLINGTGGGVGTAALGFDVRTGSTIGGGSSVFSVDGANGFGARTNATVQIAVHGSAGPYLVSGLTPGSSYSVNFLHYNDSIAGVTCDGRRILVQPQP